MFMEETPLEVSLPLSVKPLASPFPSDCPGLHNALRLLAAYAVCPFAPCL